MKTLDWQVQDDIGVLSFQRPEALNAINSMMLDELLQWMSEIQGHKKVKALILTGEGKAFIAGADIKEMSSFDSAQAMAFAKKGHKFLMGLRELPFPVIAAVNGFALGGGCEMALAADFILSSETASFGLPEVSLGLIPGFGGTQRLPKFVGLAKASEMIFTGRRYSAQDALHFGLVNAVFPQADLLDASKKIAHEIASRGPMAVAVAKQILQGTYHLSLADGLGQELKHFSGLFNSQDQKEGTRAFVEKRPAQFQGV